MKESELQYYLSFRSGILLLFLFFKIFGKSLENCLTGIFLYAIIGLLKEKRDGDKKIDFADTQ